MCEECKSKVKFEITKQDGILKNYLLKMGMYEYFFESKQHSKNYASTSTNSLNHLRRHSTSQPLNKPMKFYVCHLKICLILLNLIFLSLLFIFTSFKSETLDFKSSDSLNGVFNSKLMLKYKPIVLNMFKNGQENAQSMASNIINGILGLELTNVELLGFFNRHSPLVLLTLAILSLIIVFSQGNNPINNLIILLNAFLITFNYSFVSNYFKSFLVQEENHEEEALDFLRYFLIFLPLIVVLLVLELFATIEKLLSNQKLMIKPKKILETTSISTNYNPQNLHYTNNSLTQTHNALSHIETPMQYTLNNTKNYSLMKYLNSNSNSSQAKTVLKETTRRMVMSSSGNNLCSKIMTRKTSSDLVNIIKPANFSPSVCHGGSTSGKVLFHFW